MISFEGVGWGLQAFFVSIGQFLILVAVFCRCRNDGSDDEREIKLDVDALHGHGLEQKDKLHTC
jgi:hypothetical protein